MFGSRYAVFRGANKQKHMFKQDPKVIIWGQPAKVVGGRLLVSGFW
jgi:delta14-sterol reductase